MPGENWKGRIDEHLNSASVILLLVSASFLASNYCYEIEMTRAIERHDAGEAVVIPIILRPCDWEGAPFSKLQALPRDARPVISWPIRDEAYAGIAQEIRAAARRLRPGDISVSRSGASSGKSKLRPLLPYLCDRSEQEAALGTALRLHRNNRPRRPIICVVHGDERESHGWFLERLRYRSLPRILEIESRQLSVKDYPLRPPRRADTPDVFWPGLGDTLLENPAASSDEILKFISNHEEPLMVSLDLLTEDFEGSLDNLLHAFIKFCHQWPDLPAERTVICCVCLKYQRFAGSGWLDFKKRKLRQLNATLRSSVEAIDCSTHANVTGVVLPEVRAIPHGDVITWSRHDLVREFCQIEDWEIRELYDRKDLCNSDGHIEMEALAEELKKLMRKPPL